MQLSQTLRAENIVPELKSSNRFDAVEELLGALVDSHDLSLSQLSPVRDAVFRTQRKGEGLHQGGLAVAHGISPLLRAPVAALGVSPKGIDLGSAQGAKLLLLLLYPPKRFQADHGLFPTVQTLLGDSEMVEALAESKDSKALLKALQARES